MTRRPASTVTRFWFGYARHELATMERPNKTQLALWFGSKPDDDARIFQTFGAHLRATEAHYSALDDDTLAGTTRTSNVEDLVADIITLDQFTRVIHRKSARAFSNVSRVVSARAWVAKHRSPQPLPRLVFDYERDGEKSPVTAEFASESAASKWRRGCFVESRARFDEPAPRPSERLKITIRNEYGSRLRLWLSRVEIEFI